MIWKKQKQISEKVEDWKRGMKGRFTISTDLKISGNGKLCSDISLLIFAPFQEIMYARD